MDYNSLILEPNSSTELEGFLSGTVARNRFKFIQKTKQIQDHRGDRVDDGLIRVEFAFEKPRPEVVKKTIIHDHHHHDHHHHHHDYYYPRPYPRFHWNYNDWFTGDSTVKYGSSGTSSLSADQATFTNSGGDVEGSGGEELMGTKAENCVRGLGDQSVNVNMVQVDSLGVESLGLPLDDEGITVKGFECHQSFRYGAIGELEQAKVITIQLRGISGSGTKVQQSVTVSTKLQCSTCGTKSKSSFKYCPTCGTALE